MSENHFASIKRPAPNPLSDENEHRRQLALAANEVLRKLTEWADLEHGRLSMEEIYFYGD